MRTQGLAPTGVPAGTSELRSLTLPMRDHDTKTRSSGPECWPRVLARSVLD